MKASVPTLQTLMPLTSRDPASSETSRDRLSSLFFYAAVILLGYLLYLVFAPFLISLGWAAILVVLFHPWHSRLARRMGDTRAAAFSTAGVTCLLIIPALGLATLFVHDAYQAAVGMQSAFAQGRMPWLNDAWRWLVAHSPGGTGRDLSSLVSQAGETLGARAASLLGAVLTHTAEFFFQLFVTLFALFYFFRDGDRLMTAFRGVLPFEKASRERMISGARDLIRASVTTSLVIAALQGVMCGLAFALVGISAPIFWGVAMGFCSLVPVVGSALIWGPATVWLLSTGHWGQAIVLVGICAGVASLVDSFLRPILLSGHSRLNALMVFISVLGGVAVFGAIGLVLGPIVVATAAGVLEAYTRVEPVPTD